MEEPLAVDQEASVSASFIDPDQGEGHYVELDWGDGTVREPVPIYEDGVGLVAESHFYGEPGIYELTVTVTDDTGEVITESNQAVMYHPAGSMVMATVRVVNEATAIHLGLNVKPDAKTGDPVGHVRFNRDGSGFAVGFDSTKIQYLLIFGDWAIVTGTGTIDGVGEYGFLVSLLDQSKQGGDDTFRVLIWDEDEETIYDSQPDEDGIALPTTVPACGDIYVK